MNIIALNRLMIQNKINGDHIIISMSDDKDKFPPIPEDNCLGILRLEVFDYDGKNFNSLYNTSLDLTEDKIYNVDHAKKVLDFVFTNINKVDLIITQCDASISRSPGMAAALSKIINNDDEIFFKPPYYPNRLIYRTILNEYFNNEDYYKEKYNLSF